MAQLGAVSLPPPRCVPWPNWPDFLQVHAAVEDMAAGLVPIEGPAGLVAAKIAAWRTQASLPLAVDATGQIAEHYASVNLESSMTTRLRLSMCLVRLVNGVSDAHQKGAFASSVSKLAVELAGLPRWVVDLRHEASHNALPSLPALLLAAHDLLHWLLVNFWRPQELCVSESLDGGELGDVLVRFAVGTAALSEVESVLDRGASRYLKPGYCRHVLVPLLLDGQPQGVDSPLFCTLAAYPEGMTLCDDEDASAGEGNGAAVTASAAVAADSLSRGTGSKQHEFRGLCALPTLGDDAHRGKWLPLLHLLYTRWLDFSSVFVMGVVERLCCGSAPNSPAAPGSLPCLQLMLSYGWWDEAEPERFSFEPAGASSSGVPRALTADARACPTPADAVVIGSPTECVSGAASPDRPPSTVPLPLPAPCDVGVVGTVTGSGAAVKKRKRLFGQRKIAAQRSHARAAAAAAAASGSDMLLPPWQRVISFEVARELDVADLLPFGWLVELCNSTPSCGAADTLAWLSAHFPPATVTPRSWSLRCHANDPSIRHSSFNCDDSKSALLIPRLPADSWVSKADDARPVKRAAASAPSLQLPAVSVGPQADVAPVSPLASPPATFLLVPSSCPVPAPSVEVHTVLAVARVVSAQSAMSLDDFERLLAGVPVVAGGTAVAASSDAAPTRTDDAVHLAPAAVNSTVVEGPSDPVAARARDSSQNESEAESSIISGRHAHDNSNSNNGHIINANMHNLEAVVPWSVVEDWIPCPIGVLPGRLFMDFTLSSHMPFY